jgi:hypothetical protein
VTTNLNSSPDKIKKFVELGKNLLAKQQIKKLQIDVSLDCWGPQAEFLRFGLDLTRWQQNFEYLIQQKWLDISTHHVITSLSIDTVAEVQKIISEYKQKINPKIVQGYHLVDSGYEEIYHPEIFGSEFFKEKLE